MGGRRLRLGTARVGPCVRTLPPPRAPAVRDRAGSQGGGRAVLGDLILRAVTATFSKASSQGPSILEGACIVRAPTRAPPHVCSLVVMFVAFRLAIACCFE